jgi:tRNA(fMet)-specific endonuclease VapC
VTYFLDTNICIFVIKRKPVWVLQRFLQVVPGEMAISSVTLAELRYGADKSASPARNHAALQNFLRPLSVLDFDSMAADQYGKIRSYLERQGTPIGPLDTMIAAHALSRAVTLVTANTSEFSRVPGLVWEDWTKP